MVFSKDMLALVGSVSEKLVASNRRLVTAESCTGGLIGAACTEVAGSSDWFDCALVTYSNEAKQKVLGVNESTLLKYGAVSKETVTEMCRGALQLSADVSIAVSGVAGPGGGSIEKPVGTVWIGWQLKGELPIVKSFQFSGDRSMVRLQAVEQGLKGLIKSLE